MARRVDSTDYENQLAAIVGELEENRLEKLRRRAAEMLANRGILGPEEEARQARLAAQERKASRHLGMQYFSEAPNPWAALPLLSRPGYTELRVKPIFRLKADGVYVRQWGAELLMASPLVRGEGSDTWAFLDGAWKLVPAPLGTSAGAASEMLQALQDAGVTLGRGAFETGGQPTPAWAYVAGYLLDGTIRDYS